MVDDQINGHERIDSFRVAAETGNCRAHGSQVHNGRDTGKVLHEDAGGTIGDFMAGVAEDLVLTAAENADYVFVEGQGSICHPGYSPVTLSLLHGVAPRCMVLCHRAGKTRIGETDIEIPPVSLLIDLYERLAQFVRPSKVVAMAIDTSKLKEEEARELIESYVSLTGLPVTDPIRFGPQKIVDAVEEFCNAIDRQVVKPS